ncbi:MAG: tRNA-dihydrouridine synthase family protein [Firmicutes bacterium]|nr:tRNA-dihydrouridine synthase family protein [Bacillota bacterium]
MKIGHLNLKNNLIFAPLAGFSTPPIRDFFFNHGAGLCVTEMVSAKALLFDNQKTNQLLVCPPFQTPTSAQLFGSDPDDFYNACQLLPLSDFDIIDINMGCPVKKIISNGEGSALMADPKRAEKIVQAVDLANQELFKKTGKKRIVTVKTRLGIKNNTDCLSFVPLLEQAGAKMVTLHGRTQSQMYGGKADYDLIKRVRGLIKIPLAANGDVTDLDSYKRILDTGADGVMIGRGALLNPAIFLQIGQFNDGKCLKNEDKTFDKKALVLKLIFNMEQFFGASKTCIDLRKFLPYFLKGIRGNKDSRRELFFCDDLKIVKSVLSKLEF